MNVTRSYRPLHPLLGDAHVVRNGGLWARCACGWNSDTADEADADEAIARHRAEMLETLPGGNAPPSGAGRNDPMNTLIDDQLQIVSRPLTGLREHPQNPRDRATSADAITEMANSLRLHGQMQPALVRKDGLLISGHVRKWGHEELEHDSMPCIEIECDDAHALALLLASNEHITPPDPLLERDAVSELLHPRAPGAVAWTPSQVADALGRTVQWVSRRAQLRNLSPEVEAEMAPGKLLQGWPVAMIEPIAILAKSAQERLIRSWKKQPWTLHTVRSVADVETRLADELHVLGAAPFDIHDAQLVPKAGACIAAATAAGDSCRKTTASRPTLFEDQVAGDARTARCCDVACWVEKARAHLSQKTAAAKAEHGEVLIVRPEGGRGLDTSTRVLEGTDAMPSHAVRECKGTERGAKAALFVGPDGSVAQGFARREASQGGSGPRKKPAKAKKVERSDAERLKASRELVANRRMAHVVDSVHAAVLDAKTATPPLATVLEFVGAYEVKPPYTTTDGHGYSDVFHGDVKRARKYSAFAGDEEAFARLLWARVRAAVAASIQRRGTAEVRGEYDLAKWIAGKIGLDETDLDTVAAAEVPTPRWWPAEAPSRKRAAKGKAAAAGDDAAPAAGGTSSPRSARGRKTRSNPWVGLTPEERLARVNSIRKGKGLPARESL